MTTATHTSNFGLFGTSLRRFEDRDGFVPLRGARKRDFDYGSDDLPCAWREWVAQAGRAVREAERRIQAWRSQNG